MVGVYEGVWVRVSEPDCDAVLVLVGLTVNDTLPMKDADTRRDGVAEGEGMSTPVNAGVAGGVSSDVVVPVPSCPKAGETNAMTDVCFHSERGGGDKHDAHNATQKRFSWTLIPVYKRPWQLKVLVKSVGRNRGHGESFGLY